MAEAKEVLESIAKSAANGMLSKMTEIVATADPKVVKTFYDVLMLKVKEATPAPEKPPDTGPVEPKKGP